MKRPFIIVIATFALAVAAVACGNTNAVEGAQTYTVSVDTASPQSKNFQFGSFFPASLKVRPGDSIVFDNRSTQAPHTVSFGIKANRSNQPPPGLPSGAPNLAVLMPCYTDTAPSTSFEACPAKPAAQPPAFAGTGYWNSGFLVPSKAPSGPKKVTMRLAPSIAPGTYLYVCIIHRPMVASIQVVSRDDARETPNAVRDRAQDLIAKAEAAAQKISDPSSGPVGSSFKAVAGGGEGAIAVNRMFPQTLAVKAGTKVSWYMQSTFEPHTVTFGSKWNSGDDDPAAFPPSGLQSGSRYGGGLANSGIIRPGGDPSKPIFTLIFTKPGTYSYVCVLHPGMQGAVNVT